MNGRNGESNDSEDMDEDTVEVLEAPEESAEDQLGIVSFIFRVLAELKMILIN